MPDPRPLPLTSCPSGALPLFVQVTVSPAPTVIELGEKRKALCELPSRIDTEVDPAALTRVESPVAGEGGGAVVAPGGGESSGAPWAGGGVGPGPGVPATGGGGGLVGCGGGVCSDRPPPGRGRRRRGGAGS